MSRPLSPELERLLAAIVALEAGRSFDGNEPAATAGLTSQLLGIGGEPGADPWDVALVVDQAPPVALTDGPLLGRYWIGADRRGEVVVEVRDGLLSRIRLDWPEGSPERWPEPGEITVS